MGLFSRLFSSTPKPGRPQSITAGEFGTEVLQSDIPVVVDFWSPTCAPCQVMSGLLNEIGHQFIGRVKIVKMNVADAGDLAMELGIQSVPTLVSFVGGQPVGRLVGAVPLDQLIEKLELVAELKPQPPPDSDEEPTSRSESQWSDPSRTDDI